MTDRDEKTVARAAVLAGWRLAVSSDLPSADERGLPTGFLTGWFPLCRSDELSTGAVLGVRRFGQKLAVWRGTDGVARALPARCPHAWADMAIGGKVHGDWLECPFHAWRWDETGALRDIPYSVKPIKQKGSDCRPRWVLREQDGAILVWYHADRAEPLWQPGSADGREDSTACNWEFSTGLDALWNALGGLRAQYTVDGGGSLQISILGEVDDDLAGDVTVMADGPGQCRIRHAGLSGATLLAEAGPIDRDRTHLRLTMAASGDDRQATILMQAIARAIDRAKPILDRSPARLGGPAGPWLDRFRSQSSSTSVPNAYPESAIAQQEQSR